MVQIGSFSLITFILLFNILTICYIVFLLGMRYYDFQLFHVRFNSPYTWKHDWIVRYYYCTQTLTSQNENALFSPKYIQSILVCHNMWYTASNFGIQISLWISVPNQSITLVVLVNQIPTLSFLCIRKIFRLVCILIPELEEHLIVKEIEWINMTKTQ